MEREKTRVFANGLTELTTKQYKVALVTQSLSCDTLNVSLSICLQSIYFIQEQFLQRKVLLAEDESCFG